MFALDLIAEQRIAAAQAEGQFDGLPGAGKPLVLDDDALVPEDARMAYRVLKNAGLVPAELEPQRELGALERSLEKRGGDATRQRAARRLLYLLERIGARRSGSLALQDAYFHKVVARFARS